MRAQLPAVGRRRRPSRGPTLLADLDRVVAAGASRTGSRPGSWPTSPATRRPAAVLGELAAAALGQQGMLWATSPVDHRARDATSATGSSTCSACPTPSARTSTGRRRDPGRGVDGHVRRHRRRPRGRHRRRPGAASPACGPTRRSTPTRRSRRACASPASAPTSCASSTSTPSAGCASTPSTAAVDADLAAGHQPFLVVDDRRHHVVHGRRPGRRRRRRRPPPRPVAPRRRRHGRDRRRRRPSCDRSSPTGSTPPTATASTPTSGCSPAWTATCSTSPTGPGSPAAMSVVPEYLRNAATESRRGHRLPRLGRRPRPAVPLAQAVVRAALLRRRRAGRHGAAPLRPRRRPRRRGSRPTRPSTSSCPASLPLVCIAHRDGDDATQRLHRRRQRHRRPRHPHPARRPARAPRVHRPGPHRGPPPRRRLGRPSPPWRDRGNPGTVRRWHYVWGA